MRLIDADALIEVLNEAQVEFDEYYKGLGRAKVITDNAPTIEPHDCVLKMFGECSYNETGCSDCLVKEKIRNALASNPTIYEFKGRDNCELDRPKGKWLPIGKTVSGINHNFCPICKHDIISEFTNYCPNCGADMRGENA